MDKQALARATVAKMYERDAASGGLGMVVEEVSPGCATVSMLVRSDMVNGHAICHGGFIFTLADSAFAFACNSYNSNTVAAGARIDFLAPAHEGDRLVATATEASLRGKTGVYDVVVTNEAGDQLALFRGNSFRIQGVFSIMAEAFICDAVRTPIGRYGGGLATMRADDLGAVPLKALQERNPGVHWESVDDLLYGCANQAGEDNRNVARMSGLLAGLPVSVSGATINRLCGSGMDAVGTAARAIKAGEAELVIAGGVESMSRAPFVMGKAESAFSRSAQIYDTTMGWRFVNKLMQQQYGIDSMPETAENVAEQFSIGRTDQDTFALWSQQKAAAAVARGDFNDEIVAVSIPRRKQEPMVICADEHPRAGTSAEGLAALPTPFRENGTVTAGNASGINDGACALLIASEAATSQHGLKPMARIVAMGCSGLEPRIMGYGPVAATRKVLGLANLALEDIDLIELNEAFAAQGLAVTRALGIADDDARINPLGGAIALGHPLGMSGARLVTTAAWQLRRSGGRYALCTMCIGVGQGIALIIERT